MWPPKRRSLRTVETRTGAIRNAEFLTRFTGQPSHSVVASVFNDREVQELVNAGAIHWFQLNEREFDAD